jgi:hypothetical protein
LLLAIASALLVTCIIGGAGERFIHTGGAATSGAAVQASQFVFRSLYVTAAIALLVAAIVVLLTKRGDAEHSTQHGTSEIPPHPPAEIQELVAEELVEMVDQLVVAKEAEVVAANQAAAKATKDAEAAKERLDFLKSVRPQIATLKRSQPKPPA